VRAKTLSDAQSQRERAKAAGLRELFRDNIKRESYVVYWSFPGYGADPDHANRL
jgi:hypothetical protein